MAKSKFVATFHSVSPVECLKLKVSWLKIRQPIQLCFIDFVTSVWQSHLSVVSRKDAVIYFKLVTMRLTSVWEVCIRVEPEQRALLLKAQRGIEREKPRFGTYFVALRLQIQFQIACLQLRKIIGVQSSSRYPIFLSSKDWFCLQF